MGLVVQGLSVSTLPADPARVRDRGLARRRRGLFVLLDGFVSHEAILLRSVDVPLIARPLAVTSVGDRGTLPMYPLDGYRA